MERVFEVVVEAAADRAWAAMTDPALTVLWNHGLRVESTFEAGATLRYVMADGTVATEAVITEIEVGRRWVLRVNHPFHPALAAEPPYRQTMDLTPSADGRTTTVTITLDDFEAGSDTDTLLTSGTQPILEAFKSVVETGKPITITG